MEIKMNEEIWKPVEGLEDKYLVSNLGRFFSKTRNAIMKQQTDKDGYCVIGLGGKICRAHRIVAQAFIPNPDNLPHINHKDGNKENNNIENLEWCTPEYNNKYKYLLGYRNKSFKMSEKAKKHLSEIRKGKGLLGENNNAKKVRCIETGKEYSCAREAEKEIGVSKGCVAHCAKGYIKTSGGFHWEYC